MLLPSQALNRSDNPVEIYVVATTNQPFRIWKCRRCDTMLCGDRFRCVRECRSLFYSIDNVPHDDCSTVADKTFTSSEWGGYPRGTSQVDTALVAYREH